MRGIRVLMAVTVIAAAGSASVGAQATASTQVTRGRVPEADYQKWESVTAGDLSPDGRWVAYELRRVNNANELHYRQVGAAQEQSVKMATSPQFTRDSRWLVYTIMPDTGAARGAGGAGAPGGGGRGSQGAGANAATARNKVGIVDLTGGTTVAFEDIQSFALSRNGAHVALRRYRAPAAPGASASRGADLVVRDLARGTQVTFGNIGDFAWSDEGTLLAMTVDVEGRTGNGVQVLDAVSGTLRSLDAGDHEYSGLAWRARSTDLAAYRSRTDTAFADTSQVVLAWKDAGAAARSPSVYDFSTDARFPSGLRVASYRPLQWSGDGSALIFGIAPREPRPARPAAGARTTPAPARVQVWHWKDLRQFHQQEVNATQDRQRTLPVTWPLGANGVTQLATDYYESLQFSEERMAVLANDQSPYSREVMSGRTYRDAYRVDVFTGKRDLIVKKSAGSTIISPNGRYVVYSQNGQWWSYDATTGKRANLTEKSKASFVDLEDDHPTPERAMYGLAGWLPAEDAVIVYDQYDAWKLNMDGSLAVRLTRGREDSTVYRYVSLDPDRSFGGFRGFGGGGGGETIDLSKPVILSTTGSWNKKSGYVKLADGKVDRLVWRDKAISSLRKARNAETYLFLEQSYADSPDYFVATSDALGAAQAVSRTNAFQGEYAWGKQVLLNYRNTRGDKLQMMLTYPADYQPGKKYPMLVYYYEKLSQGFHQYVGPSDRAVYNTQVFSQEGYFVLRPDVVFQKRNPGWSGLDCVTSAVRAVVASVADIDARRVGAMGHSWGGYQSAFYAVHAPETFAVAIAGAPLTNLVSMYGYTSGNSGLAESQHFETSQERMDVPLWEDRQAYIRNSTVFDINALRIPLLLEEGDADGNVNPFQSQELYNFGRRLGKPVVYLVYEGENHNVARAESQRDYHTRQIEWFAHYLKGEPAADWIANGETYQARQKILKAGAGQSPAPPAR
jgi:dipeptidyl aminopeptidase/acylaminoacyl peptidase